MQIESANRKFKKAMRPENLVRSVFTSHRSALTRFVRKSLKKNRSANPKIVLSLSTPVFFFFFNAILFSFAR